MSYQRPDKVVSGGSSSLGTDGQAPSGWVIETIIEGRLAWLTKPVPLEPYSFTFDLGNAHAFQDSNLARDVRCSVWCGLASRGFRADLEVFDLTDEYRAWVARDNPVKDQP